ncbi:Tyrosine recombinase XerC [Burkholderia lata]|uniref:Tyrosine recombinase XerC n=2 Tax=Burkholderia lata (strain ATCC 17760 / DSM 23089 / LMG 22485 / NCIMB 9086 / R18194 / 383) TaxID=482957 RepID=A0A6P2XMQ5_BURL3|nr:Tyrosine recombinase XerC [Burkholderia lata]
MPLDNRESMRGRPYVLASRQFSLYFALTRDGVETRPSPRIPIVLWPDGRVCFQASNYICSLVEDGVSLTGRGGTASAKASNLTALVRFCFYKNTDFISLTNAQFVEYIEELCDEKVLRYGVWENVRSDSTVVKMVRTALDFLNYLAECVYCKKNFVSKNGRIKGYRRIYSVRDKSGKPTGSVGYYWHHPSLPEPIGGKRRLPITDAHVDSLYKAVPLIKASAFLSERRYLLLRLLEETGARRIELALLTCESVYAAQKMKNPALQMWTAKKRGGYLTLRKVPVERQLVNELVNYIRRYRSVIVAKTCGQAGDTGYVLISETSGRALQANTITQEISILRVAAGILEKVGAHMFRHRFITKKFLSLIRRHKFKSVDDFQAALLDIEGLYEEIRQWTGHSSIESLRVYMHLAFRELRGIPPAREPFEAEDLSDALAAGLQKLDSISVSMSAKELREEARSLIENAVARLREFSRSR